MSSPHPLSTASTIASSPYSPSSGRLATLHRTLPGMGLSLLVACSGVALGRVSWLAQHGFTALTLAIVVGMLVGNTVYPRLAASSGAGVNFTKQYVLRLGVVLYGLRLTLQDLAHVGWHGVLVDGLVLSSTFTLAWLIGTRWLRLPRQLAWLIGAGSSICGAAAVMATEPVARARAEHVTVAVGTVMVFGTLATFAYPVLFHLNQLWPAVPPGSRAFGIYAGSTIHEVAQVIAAARAVGPAATDVAVIEKMVRVMMLAPFLITLSAWHKRGADASPRRVDQAGAERIAIPWFAFAFIGVVLFNSLHWLPAPVLDAVADLDTLALAMAMAALGLATHAGTLRRAGSKPLLLGAILFAWLVVGGALINRLVSMLPG